MFDRTMLTIKRLGKEEDLMKVGFTNFKLRHSGTVCCVCVRILVVVVVVVVEAVVEAVEETASHQ